MEQEEYHKALTQRVERSPPGLRPTQSRQATRLGQNIYYPPPQFSDADFFAAQGTTSHRRKAPTQNKKGPEPTTQRRQRNTQQPTASRQLVTSRGSDACQTETNERRRDEEPVVDSAPRGWAAINDLESRSTGITFEQSINRAFKAPSFVRVPSVPRAPTPVEYGGRKRTRNTPDEAEEEQTMPPPPKRRTRSQRVVDTWSKDVMGPGSIYS